MYLFIVLMNLIHLIEGGEGEEGKGERMRRRSRRRKGGGGHEEDDEEEATMKKKNTYLKTSIDCQKKEKKKTIKK